MALTCMHQEAASLLYRLCRLLGSLVEVTSPVDSFLSIMKRNSNAAWHPAGQGVA